MDDLQWTPAGEHVVSALHDDVAVVRIDRPEALNALAPAMLGDLAEALRAAGRAASGVVLTGTGRAFSAGDDLVATADLDRAGFLALIEGFQDLTRAVLDIEGPVVAAVNGLAVGGAAELTLACDLRIGHPDAFWLFPENGLGLTVSNASTLLLPRAVGGRALGLLLDGARIPADEALRIGLVDQLVDDPLATALDRVASWVGPGRATRWHVDLLRPDRDAVEAAMAREVAAAAAVHDAGIATTGAERFRRDHA
ncbi:enoyl-CoA hydratase/isomerase family protein [Salsipaludibacter albus]|uniref:enoyl-CoA hydratase/isomerase family protein n=1 Tax=Salsipaludibacter albus TaxID=2849650 RepID=UPI001EE4D5D4|nr:enoyl-CoA hydratase/isomerase family protein [Salsipaludibacter albus]MBY5163980.1 enoyl-CoA hydratase/isomerase family protein [Salsipaludibacter albus]